jgi:hypothetical protein
LPTGVPQGAGLYLAGAAGDRSYAALLAWTPPVTWVAGGAVLLVLFVAAPTRRPATF